MSFAAFDRWLEERGIPVAQAPEAFAQYLADQSAAAIVGGPVGEAPTVVAIPDEVVP